MPLLLASTFQFFDVGKYFADDLKSWTVACITTAGMAQIDDSPDRPDWLKGEISAIQNLAGEFFEYDLRGKNSNDLTRDLTACDLIYCIGGNTYCLLQAVNKSGFREFAPEYLKAGKSIWGGSAGACVCCPDIGFIGSMDDPSKADLDSTKGMGLTDLHIIPHWKGGHQAEAEQCLADNPDLNIVCLKDDQAIYIENNKIEMLV